MSLNLGPRRVIGLGGNGGGAWTPAMLGESLLAWWDAERSDLITRPSGATVSSWKDIVAGYDAVQATSTARPTWSAKSLGGVLNKVTIFNANPTDLTGTTLSTSGGATLTLVDDAAAIATAPEELGRLAASGRVFKLDNSSGSGDALVDLAGVTGNVEPHTISAWVRGGTGYLALLSTSNKTDFNAAAGYRRVVTTLTPTNATRAFRIAAKAGQVVYFILPQMTQTAEYAGFDIVTEGAPTWGGGKAGLVFDGSDDYLSMEASPFPVNADACEMWALASQEAPASDQTGRRILAYGGSGGQISRHLARISGGTLNRLSAVIGDGTVGATASAQATAYDGVHVARAAIGGASTTTSMDGVPGAPVSIIPVTSSLRTRIGSANLTTASGFWWGKISQLLISSPLTDDQAAQLTTYLKARGGIA